jgi:hypothetical protein
MGNPQLKIIVAKMDKYDLYLIECITTNNKYIGQCSKYLSNGKKWGYKNRYKQHMSTSSKCIKLKNSLKKYGEGNHRIKRLLECKENEIDSLETAFIIIFDTLHPNGMNLETGGNKYKKLSKETKKKMSVSHLGHPNYLKPDSSEKISKGLKKYWDDNPKRKLDHKGKQLPLYVGTIKKNGEIIGYCAHIHHNKKRKKITSAHLSNDEKLLEIKNFVNKEK